MKNAKLPQLGVTEQQVNWKATQSHMSKLNNIPTAAIRVKKQPYLANQKYTTSLKFRATFPQLWLHTTW